MDIEREVIVVTLHSKYLLFDNRTVFPGSMNLDPRSLYLNTELGVILESSDLVRILRDSFELMTRAENAYHLSSGSGAVHWHTGEQVVTAEPARNFGQLLLFRLFRLLPLSSQL
ncbi:MAG: phospholipase D-like domain-containing protein [Gammaproteobacteria bacterium]